MFTRHVISCFSIKRRIIILSCRIWNLCQEVIFKQEIFIILRLVLLLSAILGNTQRPKKNDRA